MPNSSTHKRYRDGVCVTLYSSNGTPVSKKIQDDAARAIEVIAKRNNLHIAVTNA